MGEGNALAYPDGNALAYPTPAYPVGATLHPVRKPGDKPHRRNWRYRIWQPGAGYDFNVYTEPKIQEKMVYIHANPIRVGLAETPEQYPWSSAAFYAGHPVAHPVTITSYAEVL